MAFPRSRTSRAFLLLAAICLPAFAARAAQPAIPAAWDVPVPDSPAPFLLGTPSGFVVMTRAGRASMHPSDGGPAIWDTTLPRGILTTPVAAGDRLAVPLDDGSIALLDSATGRLAAKADIGVTFPRLSALPRGIAVSDPEGSLVLLHPEDGAIAWKTRLHASASAAAALCGEDILVGTADGSLVSIASGDGHVRWVRKVGERITTAPLCDGRRAWVGSADNRLHAVKIRKKGLRRLWSYLSGGDVVGRPIRYDGRVLFFSYDTYLYALEEDNGHLAWKVRLGRRPQDRSVLLGSLLLVAPLNTERLDLFRLPGGVQAATFSLADGQERFVTPPALSGSFVVIGAARYGEETARIIGLDPLSSLPAGHQPAPDPRVALPLEPSPR